MSKKTLITQAEYARRRGVSKASVGEAVKAGRISLVDGKIDPDAADRDWKKNSRVRAGSGGAASSVPPPAASPAPESFGDPDYAMSRARREAAEAGLAELELAKTRGDLIEVAAVERTWAQFLAGAREQLLQMVSRLGPLLAAESDQFKVEHMLGAEINQTLTHLSAAEVKP